MLATIQDIKTQLGIESESEDLQLELSLKIASSGIESYCNRKFEDDYNLPGNEDPDLEKEDLPFDIRGAAILWAAHNYQNSGSIGLTSERIDGLGQKNYARMELNGKQIPAPPHVLAMVDPYRWMNS